MTHNQIEFQKLKLGQAELQEKQRSNRANEGIERSKVAETSAHNRASEAVAAQDASTKLYSATEGARHNRATEMVATVDSASKRLQAEASTSQAESASRQADVAALKQREDARHNLAQEGIGYKQAAAAQQQASAASLQASTQASRVTSQNWVDQQIQSREGQLHGANLAKLNAEATTAESTAKFSEDQARANVKQTETKANENIASTVEKSTRAVKNVADAISPF